MSSRGTRGIAQIKKKPMPAPKEVDDAYTAQAKSGHTRLAVRNDTSRNLRPNPRTRPFQNLRDLQHFDHDDNDTPVDDDPEYDPETAAESKAETTSKAKRPQRIGTTRPLCGPRKAPSQTQPQDEESDDPADQPETPEDHDPGEIGRRKAERRKQRAARKLEKEAAKFEGERFPRNEGLIEEPENSYMPGKIVERRKR